MKYVIQVATTDVQDVTAKVNLIAALRLVDTDGSSDYPWFVEGNDPIFIFHNGNVRAVKRAWNNPWDIWLCVDKTQGGFFVVCTIFRMFDFTGLKNSSGDGYANGDCTQSCNGIELTWNLLS